MSTLFHFDRIKLVAYEILLAVLLCALSAGMAIDYWLLKYFVFYWY